MFAWEVVKRFRRRISACVCVVVIGSLQFSSAQGSHTCPTTIAGCKVVGCSTSSSTFAPYDALLNRQKNRSDGPAVVKNPPYTVADTLPEAGTLPVHTPKPGKINDLRNTWQTTPEYAEVSQVEHTQGTVEGYILHAHAGGPESCNCGIKTASVLDTHVNIVDKPGANVKPETLPGVSLIAEVTWRVRKTHPDWTVANLTKLDLSNAGARVRVTGDLLYDNVHTDMLKKNPKQRGTLWEIHPIRKIQVLVRNNWVDLSAAKSVLGLSAGTTQRFGVAAAPGGSPSAGALTNAYKPNWTDAQKKLLEQSLGEDRS